MSGKRKRLRQQVKAEADQLATVTEPTFRQAARRFWLEIALFWRIPDLVDWLEAKLTRKGG